MIFFDLLRSRKGIAAIFLLLSAILGMIAVLSAPSFPIVSDSLDYHNIALGILDTGKYIAISSDDLIYPPLYPLFLSAIYALAGTNPGFVYFFQFLLTGGLAIFIFLIAEELGLKRRFSILAGFLVLVWPYLVLYSLLIASEILYAFFLAGAILFIIRTAKNPIGKNIVWAGILMGLAVLTRPVALLLPFWLVIGGIILHHLRYVTFEAELFRKFLIAILVYLAILIPWTGYVYFQFGRIIPVASNLSHVFTKANETYSYLDKQTQTDQSASSPSWITAKLKNIYLFWNPGAGGYNADTLKSTRPGIASLLTIYKIEFFLVLIFAAVSLRWSRRDPLLAILIMTVLYFWALHTVLFPFPRYTLPIIPVTIILACYSLLKIKNKWLQRY